METCSSSLMGRLRGRCPLETSGSLERWLTGFDWVSKEMDARDVAATARFLRRCCTIDPHHRPTASELLRDDWFRS
ncbi:hypothetical protein NUW54_g11759 [Trametes sanguinea]|uniref:Uncharacterized protein n=1 Tax=Trametes sanguinea TaxID=158606 RepID=A0ACC1N8S8_9APHY|nr:hypothetical protein NUW54_g11759 [Trametes sanguinea]